MSGSRAQRPAFVLTGLGMRCAVGQNATQSAASVRAGICRFRTWPHDAADVETESDLVAGAPVQPDRGDIDWIEKLDSLAQQPLVESLWMAKLDHLADAPGDEATGLYLGVPPLERVGVDPDNAKEFLDDLKEGTLFPFTPTKTVFVANGSASALKALEMAMNDLEAGTIEVAVVGGVDSLLHSPYLAELASQGRLKNGQNPAALIPGEAAAFVVVETEAHARARGAEALAAVTPPTFEVERDSPDGSRPTRGQASAQALRKAVSAAPVTPDRIGGVLADLNGERWKFLEFAMAVNPALAGLPPDWRPSVPSLSLGDIGAATAAAYLCLATTALRRGYARGAGLLLWTASDTGERAVAIVHQAPPTP